MVKYIVTVLVILSAALSSAMAQNSPMIPQDQAQIQLSFAPLVKKVAPAVVNIYTERIVTQRASPFMDDPFFSRFFGHGFGFGGGGITRQHIENALGSGVIVAADGLVVTNAHVIKDAEDIKIILADGREYKADKALVDERSDLALLRFDTAGESVPFIELKPSESLEVGDLVLAIGNPFGVGQTVTSGIVSALARSSLNINDFNFFIQTDAAINPGNSGGPLIAMDGTIIGINTAIYSRTGGNMGLGFAIPSEMLATVIAAEQAGQTGGKGVVRPWLGMTAQKVTADIARSLDMPRPVGVLIASLHSASPALKHGLKVGDVVLAVNGSDIRDPAEMKFRMATVPLGSDAVFTVLRQGKQHDVNVEAIAPPDIPPRNETLLSGAHPFAGVIVAHLNPAVALEYGLSSDDDSGVVILGFEKRSAGSRFFSEGDVIVQINDMVIKTVKDMQNALKNDNMRGWDMTIRRNGRESRILLR